jgi:hypothetical protein
MLIVDNRRFVQTPFDSEDELERVVVENIEYIFGPASIYFPKALITTHGGGGTVPDGFVVDLEGRRWYIVEAELSRHSVWSHIAPQVAKQLIAATNPLSRQRLVDLAAAKVRDDSALQDRFAEQDIHLIDVRRVLDEIIATEPIVGMPIDAVKNDLREWAATLRVSVKLWIVRKYVEFGHSENVMYEIPEEFQPVLDTADDPHTNESGVTRYDVSIADLIDAGILDVGEKLTMPYKPRNGIPQSYEARILDGGSLEVLGKAFSSPSYAALHAVQNAGSTRTTINGWAAWRTKDGSFLSDVREKYLHDGARPS